jgi:threonine synthase
MSIDVCSDCGSPLDVEYVTDHKPGGKSDTYEARTPVHSANSGVSLGEGNTPCVELKVLGESLGMRHLHAKLEFLNPTGSFKDRGTAVMLSVAMDHGVTELVEDSSGNAGASVSAYSARAGIKAHVFVPADAPQAKLRQIRVYGAEVHPIEGSRDAVTAAAMDYHRQHGLVYASHMLSPYFAEGTKTFAYEVAQQFDGALPDHIVFPVGNGSLFIGAYKGFCEMQAAGTIDKIPRLHCVQALSVMPLVAAFTGQGWDPGAASRTVAGGIAIAAPSRQDQILDILRLVEGTAAAVEESNIVRMHQNLAEQEGIFAEPTSAAAFAGLYKIVKQGIILENDTVLVPVTGFGLKDEVPR